MEFLLGCDWFCGGVEKVFLDILELQCREQIDMSSSVF